MSARLILFGVVAVVATSSAIVGGSVRAASMYPARVVANGARAEARKRPPRYRYMFRSQSGQAAVASHGWNLLDVSSQQSADALPARTRGLVWAGGYDGSTCDWEVSDSALRDTIAAMAGDPKVAGFYLSDEPDPHACPTAPDQHRARSALIHGLDPGKLTVMTMDSNSGQASLDQVPLWVGAADYVCLDPYPCGWNQPCQYSWIDAIIAAANQAGLSYWGVVQAFADSEWRWPTARELRHMLSQWAGSRQSGYGVFAWTWDGGTLAGPPGLLRALAHLCLSGCFS